MRLDRWAMLKPYLQGASRWLLACLLLLSWIPWATASDEASADAIRRASELLVRGDLSGAEKEANLALSSPSTQPLAYAALGAIRLKQKEYAESERLLQKAIRLNPDLVGARLNLGSLYLLQQKTPQAAEAFRRVLTRDPLNAMARFSLARIENDQRDYTQSIQLLKPILSAVRQTPDGLLTLAASYLGAGDKVSAKNLVSDWKALNESDANSSLSFAMLLSRSDLDQEAIEVLEEAKKANPSSYEVAFNLAGSYAKKGDLKQASSNYELALSNNENCTACLLQLSYLADREEDVEKSLAYLIQAKRKNPDNAEVLFEFGKICLKKDLLQDATKALERAVELEPQRDSYVYVLASARVGTKRFDEARVLLDGLLKKNPNDPQLNYALGAVFYLEAKVDEAAGFFRKSLLLDPGQVASLYYLGAVAQSKGESSEATKIFQEILQRHPNHAASHEGLGAVLLKEGKYAEAAQHLERAVELNPNSAKAHYQLGLLFARLGKSQESKQELEIFKKLQEEEKDAFKELFLLTPH
jgi:tetratricopeptide (TPR) repeat protein